MDPIRVQKNLGQNIIWLQKSFGSQKILGPKKIGTKEKKILSKKYLIQKKFGQKIVVKNVFDPKKIGWNKFLMQMKKVSGKRRNFFGLLI